MSTESSSLAEVDKRHYNYWQALVMSFYSNALYVDVGKRWRKLAIGYLLLALALASIPFSLRIMYDFRQFYREQLLAPLEKLPLLTVQNGEVSYDGPMPFFGKNNKGQIVTIVDTTGSINEKSIAQYPQLGVLITKNQFIYWAPSPTFFFAETVHVEPAEPIVQRLDPAMNDVFDGSKWIESSGIKKVYYLSQFIIYPSVLFIMFSLYLVSALVFAMMVQLIVNLFLKFSLTYPQACRLLIVSATPQIFVLMTFLTVNWVFPGSGMILLLLLAGYLTYAVVALKKASNKLVLA